MMFFYLFLFGAILSTALGQFFYKKYSLTNNIVYLLITIFLFVITPVFSFLALKKIPVDVVYMFTSLTIFLVILFSKVFLNEEINKKTYVGVLLIIIGVLVYGL